MPAGRLVPPVGVDELLAGFVYEEPGRSMVAALKFRNQRAFVPWAADVLVGALALAARTPTVITWAPTSRSRRRERGFDQARLLARATGRRLGLPAQPCLGRQAGASQTGRSRVERLAGPTFVPTRSLRGHTVVVVDDVVTTGATLARSAAALRAGGAAWVIGLGLAATPHSLLKSAPQLTEGIDKSAPDKELGRTCEYTALGRDDK